MCLRVIIVWLLLPFPLLGGCWACGADDERVVSYSKRSPFQENVPEDCRIRRLPNNTMSVTTKVSLKHMRVVVGLRDRHRGIAGGHQGSWRIVGFCLHFSICACHPCAGAVLNLLCIVPMLTDNPRRESWRIEGFSGVTGSKTDAWQRSRAHEASWIKTLQPDWALNTATVTTATVTTHCF